MSALITINCQGDIRVHLPGTGNYATVCGLDGDDVDQETLPTRRGARVDCDECREFWNHCRSFKPRHFEVKP